MTGLSLDRTSLEALADARRNARAALAALRALNLAAVHSDHCIELSRIGGTLADVIVALTAIESRARLQP